MQISSRRKSNIHTRTVRRPLVVGTRIEAPPAWRAQPKRPEPPYFRFLAEIDAARKDQP